MRLKISFFVFFVSGPVATEVGDLKGSTECLVEEGEGSVSFAPGAPIHQCPVDFLLWTGLIPEGQYY